MTNKSNYTSPFYVTTTDKFMSNWGLAKGKINKLIFLCDSLEEAETVAAYAESRSEQKYIRIHSESHPPSILRHTKGTDYSLKDYYVQIKTKDIYPEWYRIRNND